MKIIDLIKKNLYYMLHLASYLKSPLYLRSRYDWFYTKRPYTWLDDKFFIEYYFQKKMGYRINLKNPSTFNEKLNWMKLYDRDPLYTQISDKWQCRDYVSQKIGTKYLKPLLGVCDNVEDINWQDMPEKFVIKATHGSGWNIICNNEKQFSRLDAEEKLKGWLAENFYQRTREWQYKHIHPRVIVEPYLEGDPRFGLVEYQFYCFDGITKFVQVDIDCNNAHTRLFLTPDWQKMPFTIIRFPIFEGFFPKPQNFDEALSIAEKLTKGMPFCRVDLHLIDNQIFVSEMTLLPAGGFMSIVPAEYDKTIGDMLTLNKKYLIRPIKFLK